jgi:hypothetical protein
VAGGAGKKRPTAVSSRGFLSKACLVSTSANGVAQYDDHYYLSNLSSHYELKIAAPGETGQVLFAGFFRGAAHCDTSGCPLFGQQSLDHACQFRGQIGLGEECVRLLQRVLINTGVHRPADEEDPLVRINETAVAD